MNAVDFLKYRIEVLHDMLQSTYSQLAEAQQNVKEQAEIILKRNLQIIELSQRVGELKKELAESQAEVKSQAEEIADAHSTIGFMQEGLDRWKADCDKLQAEVVRLEELVFAYESVRAPINPLLAEREIMIDPEILENAVGYIEIVHAIQVLEYHDKNLLSHDIVTSPKLMNERQRAFLLEALEALNAAKGGNSEFYNRVSGSIEEGIKGEKGGDDEVSEV